MLRRPLVAVLAVVSTAVGLPTLGVGVEAAGADPVTPKAVLVTEGTSISAEEMPLFNRLKGLGFFEVETVADEAMNAARTRGANLVVVSPTVASVHFTGDELVKVSVPIISMKAYEQDGLQMAGSTAGVDHGTFTTDRIQITDTDPPHPLAAGLSGTLIITKTPLAIGWVKLPAPGVDAQTVAKNLSAEGNAVLFAWKPGDRMFPETPPNGTVELLNAHGCRVGFPGQRDSAKEFTAEGWTLFDAAVSWSQSSACGPTRPYPVNPPVKTCMPKEAPADIAETATNSAYHWPQWVDEVLYDNGIYYLGGRFTHVSDWDGSDTVARAGLAACNASTGDVLPWDPQLPIAADLPDTTDPSMVRSLAAHGGWLYVGGKFDVFSPAGVLKKNFLRVTLAVPPNWQASVDWNWGPALKGGVQAILIDDTQEPDAIYLGGGIREVNGDDEDQGVHELVKLKLEDGIRDPNFAPDFVMEPPLKPNCTPDLNAEPPRTCIETDPNGKEYSDFASVHSLARDGNDLYVGGAFTKVNGVNRAGVAALPKATGAGAGTFVADLRDVNSYDPAVQVHDIFVHAGFVYLCGDWWITEDQGQMSDPGKDALKDQQYNSGKFYKSGASVHVPVPDGAKPTRPWGPRTDGAIQACDIDAQSNLLYLGGHFDLINSRHIGKLAAADLTTGALLESWDSDSTRVRGLDAVEVDPGKSVAIAGTFNRTGGVDQTSFAAFAIGQPGGPSGSTTFPTQTEPVGGPIPALTKRGGGSPSTNVCACPAADPVDTSTGNFYENFTDLVVPGRGVPLAFTRSYNSSPTPAPTDGPLGYGWSFNYNMSLSIAADSVTVNEENGAAVTFALNGSAYTAPPRVMATLVRNGDNSWTFTRRNREIYLFNSSGRLTTLKDLNGYATTLSYNGLGQLATVKDPADRTLTFGWTGGRITSVTDTATPPRSISFSYSPAGDLTDMIDVGGGHSTFSYDANHRMKTKRAPKYFGDTTTTPAPEVANTYDTSGRVSTQRDPLGRTHTFDYTSIPSATKITDPKGNVRVDTFQYDLLVSRTLGYGTPAAATTQYRYDPGTLARTAIVDPNGAVTTMAYDSAGNLLSSRDPLGRTTWATYNALNLPLTVTDAAGVTTTYTYDPAGNPLTSSTPLQGSNPPVSATTTHTYDLARPGDATKTTDPDGKEWPRTWDTSGNLATEADPLGNTTRHCYDTVGRRIKVISPKGSAAAVTCTTTNPTFTTLFTNNAFGQPLVVTDPLGHQTVATYDANGNRTTSTDANGHKTTWTYDAANQLVEEIRPGGGGGGGIAVGSSTSDPNAAPASTLVLTRPAGVSANQVMVAGVAVRGSVTVTAPSGWTLIRSDANGSSMKLNSYYRIAGASEPASYTWSFSSAKAAAGTITAYSGVDTTNPVDVHGGLPNLSDSTSITAPSVTTTGPNERIIGLFATMKATTITEPAGMQERGEATASGGTEPPVTIESADTTQATAGATGNKTATAPVADRNTGQLIALRPAPGSGGGGAGTTLRYDYHPDGSLWHYYDGANQATTYEYDPLGRQTTVTDPLNRTTTNGYDPAGRLIHKQDHGGNCAAVPKTACTTMTNDDAGQLTKIDYSDPATPDVTNISYDNAGRRTAMTDGTGTSTWQWDSLGRLTTHTNGAGSTVGYAYIDGATTELLDRPLKITYPGNNVVTRTFDSAGRMKTVKDWLSNTTTFNYDANSFLTSQAYPNGTTATKTPDAAGRLMEVKHAPTGGGSPLVNFTYGRDSNDQLSSVRTDPAGTSGIVESRDWTYTAVSQLKTDNGGLYSYDAADNLAGFPSGANLAHDAANQLSSLTNTAGTTTFGYDTRGNRTTVTPPGAPATTLTYDQANRLTGHNTANAAYRYNGEGLRMSKTVSGVTTGFTWDVAQGLPLLLVEGTTNYVYGPGGLPLQQITSAGQVTYYHHDQLGSTRALTNSSGTVVATYTYDPYGKLSGSTGTATNPFRFAGQYTDAETGYQYLRARYYDAGTGTFLTRDPLEPITGTPYAYARNSPLNFIDPTGLFGLSTFGAIAGAVTGAVVNTVSYGVSCVGGDDCSVRGVVGAAVGGAVGGAIAGACIGTTAQVVACGALGGEASYLIGSTIAGTGTTLRGAITSATVGGMGNGVASLAGRSGGGYFGRPFPGNALANTAGAAGAVVANVDWASLSCDPAPGGASRTIDGAGIPLPANMVRGR